jgi:hypothetical protein
MLSTENRNVPVTVSGSLLKAGSLIVVEISSRMRRIRLMLYERMEGALGCTKGEVLMSFKNVLWFSHPKA